MMEMKLKKMTALLLALAMAFALCACKPAAEDPSDSPSEEASEAVQPSEEPSEEPSQAPSEEPSVEPSEAPVSTPDGEVRLAVLSGPTGVGAAKLLDSADNDPSSLHSSYSYTIAADNSELVAGLSSGELDIATMASNAAVNLYNKTGGAVKIIALGTLGVLHILEGSGGTTVNSIADLSGKTIYSAGQGANPEYILRYLLQENGVDDAEIVFADASEISAKLLSGDIQYAMLPVPAATAAIIKGEGSVRAAVDVTEAWDSLQNGSQLVMTAVVARTQFIEEHPELVSGFLDDYKDSISFVNSNIDAAAELVAGYGITPNAAIAKQAIPQCHLTFISGADMLPAISDYFSVLYSLDPASVGGALPDDGIYYVP